MARVDLSLNKYIERFVSQDHIDSNDVQFWYQLLSCSFNFMKVQDSKIVDKALDPYLVRLTLNNPQSFNIGSLLRVFLDRVSRIKSQTNSSSDSHSTITTNPYYVFQSFNALYLLKSICKSFIENLSEEQLMKALRAKVDTENQNQATRQTSNPILPPEQHQAVIKKSQPIDENQSQVVTDLSGNVSNGNVSNDPQTTTTNQPPGNQAATPSSTETSNGQSPLASNNDSIEPKIEFTSGAQMLDQFISTLIAIIVDFPFTDSTYLIQVEAINALIVLLSVQMYSNVPANQSIVYRSLMQKKCSIHALILTKTLLNNFVKQAPMPQEAGSIIIGLASGLWKVLTLGYGGISAVGAVTDSVNGLVDGQDIEPMPPLAKQSLLLLNILTNHHTREKNPYREAIISCQDSKFDLSDPKTAFDNANDNDALATATKSKVALNSNSIKIDFKELYETLCKYLHDDQVALLLYLLLHSNKIFRPYLLYGNVSSKLDKLLLPLLKILYSSIEKGSHHVYMVLIIFIILSEEDNFNKSIHQITIRGGIPWYKDRVLNDITLGGLTALIIIRSLQYNTFRVKDKFLHANLFATLANLSNHFNNLHPYVCQRLVDLLERLSKRYIAATKPISISGTGNYDNIDTPSPNRHRHNFDDPLARALATDTHKQDLHDASSIELDSAINISIPPSQGPVLTENNTNTVLPPVDIHGQEQQVSASNNNGTIVVDPQNSTPSNQIDNASPNNDCQINISLLDEARQDISFIEEVIRMILEVVNNSLATQLNSNTDLIYTLLYKRSIFTTLISSHQSFYNMVVNIERILTFFYNKIEAYDRQLSVVEIKELIQDASKDWNYSNYQNNLHENSNRPLLFHYVEDEQPEEFFVPYIWTRVYYSSGIAWNSKRIVLFNPDDL